MTSLIATIVFQLGLWLLTALLLAHIARWLGSPKAKLRNGLLALFLVLLIDVVSIALGLIATTHAVPVVNPLLGIADLFLTYLVLLRVFSLSKRRTFVLYGSFLLWIAVQFVLVIAVVRPYLGEAFVLQTTVSMSPTLVPGDRFVVNKLGHAARWDLVAYHSIVPGAPVYCKRIVGLPGERLRFDQGNIYINDQLMAAPSVVAGRYHATFPTVPSMYRDGQTIVLSDREFFVVGDNVDFSADSRIYGPTDRSAIVGVVDFVYWPPSDARIVRH